MHIRNVGNFFPSFFTKILISILLFFLKKKQEQGEEILQGKYSYAKTFDLIGKTV